MMNSIVLGITEPIEFSFMYSMPRLFYWFHTTMCGVSFLTMKLLDAHIPTAFSGGIIELIINGVIPVQKSTSFWWWAVVGSGLAVVYFAVFYYFFRQKTSKKKNYNLIQILVQLALLKQLLQKTVDYLLKLPPIKEV